MPKVYLTGADGLLGTAFAAALGKDPLTAGWTVRGVARKDFDIADTDAVRASMDAFAPDIVVHTAAHAIVDDCEADPKLALRVNIAGTSNVVEGCRRHGSRLVYISSDYVFDGRTTPLGGYREDDVPNPVSVYGLTKLAGERLGALVPRHLNIRTSWLFGGADDRVDLVLDTVRRIRRGERVPLIADQFSRPTYVADLARAMVFLLTREEPVTGTIHIVNEGTASWYEVGRHLCSVLGTGPEPEPLSMDACGFLGDRPANSALATSRLDGLGFTMPSWQDAARRFCEELEGALT